jgi:hypothetical protein
MQIICVRTGTMYPIEYVERLRDAVAPHPLLCVTDQPEEAAGVTNIPAPNGVTGWWTKCWLYSVDAPQPVLALDLDLVFLQPIDPLLDFNGPTTIRDFYTGGRRGPHMNGSVTLIDKAYPQVWENYRTHQRETETTYPTDQHYLWHCDIPWAFYPDAWCQSYRRGTITDETKIVVFHGQPKPHEVGWIASRPSSQWLPE